MCKGYCSLIYRTAEEDTVNISSLQESQRNFGNRLLILKDEL